LIFSRFGTILSCEVIRDKRTGDSLQYAFIEFENQKDCEQAYFKMQGVLIDDHRIHVDFSQSVRPTPLESTDSLHQHAQLQLSTSILLTHILGLQTIRQLAQRHSQQAPTARRFRRCCRSGTEATVPSIRRLSRGG
jgi:RNA recognition motif-containing protein